MSIFSSIKSAVKSVASKVASTVKKFTGNQSATALQATLLPGASIAPKSVEQPSYRDTQTGKVYTSAGLKSAGLTSSSPQIDKGQGYVPAGFSPVLGGGNIQGAINTGQYSGGSSYTALTPGQFGGSRTLGGGQTSSGVDQSFFNPVNTSTITSSTFKGNGVGNGVGGNTPAVSLANTPTNRDTGNVNLAGLANPDTKINPATGLFDIQGDLNKEGENDVTKAIRELSKIPEKENVYDNPLIKEQNEEIRRQKQEVNNWQGQLNNIVAKQQQDLMRHEKEISLAGGTVEGFSGRAAAINREAAYSALPVQAMLATSQGNLELAQDYLKDLTTMVKEEIDNNYTYKMAQYNAVKDIADKREKVELDRLEKEEQRTYDEKKDNLKLVDSWMQKAIATKQPNLINRLSKLNIYSPNFRQDLAGIIGGMGVSSSGGSGTRGGSNVVGGSGTQSLSMTEELDTKFQNAGIDTGAIIRIQNALNSGQDLESAMQGLTDDQKKLIRDNIKTSGGSLGTPKIVTTANGQQININSVDGIKALSQSGYTAGEIKAYLTKEGKMSVTTADQLLKDAGLTEDKKSSSSSSMSDEEFLKLLE